MQSKPSGESIVFISRKDKKAYKKKNPYAKTPMKGCIEPEDAIYEHLVHNLLFSESRYAFEGISDEDGDVRIILSQDFVESVSQPNRDQIVKAMALRGLKPEGKYSFGNDLVSVTDVIGDNVLVGKDNKLFFIDPIICFKKPVREVLAALVGNSW